LLEPEKLGPGIGSNRSSSEAGKTRPNTCLTVREFGLARFLASKERSSLNAARRFATLCRPKREEFAYFSKVN